jgi:hypothetical protein
MRAYLVSVPGAEDSLAQSRADAARELARIRDEMRAAQIDLARTEGRREAAVWRADELASEVQSVRRIKKLGKARARCGGMGVFVCHVCSCSQQQARQIGRNCGH